jgi:predicted DNA-binding transcriptional regulator AlpA
MNTTEPVIDIFEVSRRLGLGTAAVSARIKVGTLPRPQFRLLQENGRPRLAWALDAIKEYLPRH